MRALFLISPVLLLLLLPACTNFRRLYDRERSHEIESCKDLITNEVLTEEDIAKLPEPIKRYIRICGYIGQPRIVNADLIWSESFFRSKPEAKWMKMKTRQFNSVPQPMRIAHMKTRMLGLISFEGRDKFDAGQGHMFGKLGGLFTIFDARDPEIAKSALIVIFAEIIMLPEYALQDYITWESWDEKSATARINYMGIEARGTFFFDDMGFISRFETNDRLMDVPGQAYQQHPYYIEVLGYHQERDITIPHEVSANWILDDNIFCYWKGKIARIIYNVKG